MVARQRCSTTFTSRTNGLTIRLWKIASSTYLSVQDCSEHLGKSSRKTSLYQINFISFSGRRGRKLAATAKQISGIDDFFKKGNDELNPKELGPTPENFMIIDDLMLSRQNRCEDYFKLHRQWSCQNANFIWLFQQDTINHHNIRRDNCNNLTKEQFDKLCNLNLAEPFVFMTIDLTSRRADG